MKLLVLSVFLLSAPAYAAGDPEEPLTGALPGAEMKAGAGAGAELKAMQGRLDPALTKAVAESQKDQASSSSTSSSSSSPPSASFRPGAPAYGSANVAIMTAAFDEAKVPDCLHSEGLKRQPTFFLSGLLALPFIGVAKLRGKCI